MDGYEPLWLSPLTRSPQESVRCEPLSQEVTSVAKSLRESASKEERLFHLTVGLWSLGSGVAQYLTMGTYGQRGLFIS